MPITQDRQVEWADLLLDPPYHVQSVEGLLGAEVRGGNLPRVARGGSVPGRRYAGERAITLTIDVTDHDPAVFAEAVVVLAAKLAEFEDEQPLRFRIPGIAGGQAAFVNARPTRVAGIVDALYHQAATEIVVEFVASDPLIYSETTTTVSLGLPAGAGGFTFPLTFPFVFGALGGISTVQLVNTGAAVSPDVTVRVFGPVDTPTLRNETTGQAVTVGMVVDAGDWLDIDMAARSVLLNGTASRYHELTVADFWGLAPGANQVRYSAVAQTSSTAQITARSAWS